MNSKELGVEQYSIPKMQIGRFRWKGEAMNIRKNIDYSLMFDAMRVAMSADNSQMKLYCELGHLIC